MVKHTKGRPKSEERKENTAVTLFPEEKEALFQIASDNGMTASQYGRQAILEKLKKDGFNGKK